MKILDIKHPLRQMFSLFCSISYAYMYANVACHLKTSVHELRNDTETRTKNLVNHKTILGFDRAKVCLALVTAAFCVRVVAHSKYIVCA